ncbi:MAG: family 10 glycosylhydrolase [Planctomycetota bacterium]|nr:family 10 glycosylhydrolase [Planctomycetota bacterium]
MRILNALRKAMRCSTLCRLMGRPFGWHLVATLCLLWLLGKSDLQYSGIASASEMLAQGRSTMRLRIAWGGGTATPWQGTVSVNEGEILDHEALGVSEDEPGSMWIEQGILHVGEKSSREYDGVDIAIEGSLESDLTISLRAGGQEQNSPALTIPLKELIEQPFHDRIGPESLGNQIMIQRQPGDRLRVTFENRSLLFRPSEKFELQLTPHLLGLETESRVTLHSQILVARSDQEVTRQIIDFKVPDDEQRYPPVPLQFELPEEEGVYDLVLTVKKAGERFSPTNPFRNPEQVIAQRKVQFVVLRESSNAQNNQATATPPGNLVTEILPTNPWWKKVSQIPTLAGFKDGPIRHGEIQLWQHPTLGAWTRLAASPNDPQTVWAAYPLTVSQPGQPHVLEVEYPSDISQSMGVSLLEPDAAGNLLPLGIDSGIVVDDQGNDDRPTIATHQMIFWPKTKNPFVLITNARRDAPAVHGAIRVQGPRIPGFPGIGRPAMRSASLPSLFDFDTSPDERLFAGYMGEPLFPENFSATEFLDQQRSLDDWVTFYEASTRLVEYLKYGGYNTLVLSVLAKGGAIYPSDRLQPTPRYDTGIFASTGQDPIRKDVLELLLRLCDREGIQLIPSLQFSTPLPMLEEKRRQAGNQKTGILLTDAKGRSWRDPYADDGNVNLVRYNPLHADVQQELLQIVREMIDRYGAHPSFAGLAVDLSGRGCTVFPGPAWGRDPMTYQQFLDTRENVLTTADTNGPDAVDEERAWLEWRANRLGEFHSKLSAQLRADCPEAKLFIATAGVEVSPDLSEQLRPALPNQVTPEQLLLGVGLSAKNYRHPRSGIILLQSRVMAADFSRIDPAAAQEVGRSLSWDQPFAEIDSVGHFLQSRPRSIRLPSFEKQSPFGTEATFLALAPHLVPTGADSRELLVRDLARANLDTIMIGGAMLPLGQEDACRSIVTAYRQLPKGRSLDVSGNHDPLVIRKLVADGASYLTFTNPSSWPCRVTVQIGQAKLPAMKHLSLASAPEVLSDGRIQLNLQPHDFRAIHFEQAELDVANVEVSMPANVHDLLEKRINELADRTSQLKNRPTFDVLKNTTFETADAIGWQADQKGSLAVDANEAHTGQSSLRFENTVVRSHPFSPPVTGRLSFSVWLKTSEDALHPLRMGIEGKHRNQSFYRYGEITVGSEWKMFEYQIDDLPLADLGPLTIRFEHADQGNVWLDDIVVSDLYFSENERKELSRLITQAHFSLTEGNFVECGRLLDGYWPRFLQRYVPLPATKVAVRPMIDPPRVPVEEAKAAVTEQPWWKKFPGLLR